MRKTYLYVFAFCYKRLLRPIFFLWGSETIHTLLVGQGESVGNNFFLRAFFTLLFSSRRSQLFQTIHGVVFASPVGLSAGFDYDAQLTQLLPALGFGFGTIGTITYMPYAGNRKPMLGRLVQSQSLMVNKGLKNRGVVSILKKLKKKNFAIPIGISIGMTNTQYIDTPKQAIDDIVAAFTTVKNTSVPFSYYELNISCPNMHTPVSFYDPKDLNQLLKAIKKVSLRKPLFIKMPISLTNQEFFALLAVIVRFPVQGVIIGNLQKDRTHSAFNKQEIKKYPKGNFSGKPTMERSNELIALTYKTYGDKLTIIGSGGIFSAQDAYEKIQRGASLVQLITGLIFEGPQLIAQINEALPELLQRDGFTHIDQAVGSSVS